MHGPQSARRTWTPCRDWEAVWALVDRWPGLRAEHNETWLLLCRLCPDGRRALTCDVEELLGAHKDLRGKRFYDAQLIRRLRGLERAGLIHWTRRGAKIVIGLHDPRQVPIPARPAARAPRVTAGGDRQRPLFPGDSARILKLFAPDSPDALAPQLLPGGAKVEALPDAPEPEALPLPSPSPKPEALPLPASKAEALPLPETAMPPGESGGEGPRASSSRAALQIPKNTNSILPNPQTTKDTKYQSTSKDPPRRGAAARESGAWDPPSIGEAVAEETRANLDRMANPVEQSARLVERVLAIVPELRPRGVYLATWAARLVIFEHRLYPADVEQILADVVAMRDAATQEKPFEPGAFFNFKLKELTESRGIPWEPTGGRRPQRARAP